VCSTNGGIILDCRIGRDLSGCDRDIREEQSLLELRKTTKKCESGFRTFPRNSKDVPPKYKSEALYVQLTRRHDPGDHKISLLLILLHLNPSKSPSFRSLEVRLCGE
jgi:hypothetical protein